MVQALLKRRAAWPAQSEPAATCVFILALLSCFGFQSHRALAFGRKIPDDSPCPQIRIVGADRLDLTDTEIRLICGDPESERIGKAWKNIPLNQAKLNFQTFIQDRGYFFPKFQHPEAVSDSPDTSVAIFDPGVPSTIRKIEGRGLPPEVEISKFRRLRGETLTPQRVSEAADWVQKRLQEEGWACAKVEAGATPEDGLITITWTNPGAASTFGSVVEDTTLDLGPGIIRRYDAFSTGQPYSLIKTEITSHRSSSSRVVYSQILEPNCPDSVSKPSAINLQESIETGAPRLVLFSVGANTESLLVGKISWAHTRLSDTGSLVELSARGSLKEQSLRAHAEWYFLRRSSRQRVVPHLQFAHENELRYELVALRFDSLWRSGAELDQGSVDFGVGLGWRDLQQVGGIGPLKSRFPLVEADASYASHLFEYYAASPRTGYRLAVSAAAVADEISGAGHPLRFGLEGTWLVNPGSFDPPWVVVGARGGAFYTLVPENTRMENLPIEFRQWLGGGRDVRGFGRTEIPGNDFGSRLGAFGGVEARFPHSLPFELQPLAFLDFAWLRSGEKTTAEATQGFLSPGFGLRWESPIGAVRGNVAHGYVVGEPESALAHWQFYLSLGEEF